jgi:hypothetical protein
MFQEKKIREGPRGTSRIPAGNIIPPEARLLPFRTNSYEFYIHRNNGHVTLYINIIDYHPGILAVPLKKLAELINYLRKN